MIMLKKRSLTNVELKMNKTYEPILAEDQWTMVMMMTIMIMMI